MPKKTEIIHSPILLWEETETPDECGLFGFVGWFCLFFFYQIISFLSEKKNKETKPNKPKYHVVPHLKDRVQIKDCNLGSMKQLMTGSLTVFG